MNIERISQYYGVSFCHSCNPIPGIKITTGSGYGATDPDLEKDRVVVGISMLVEAYIDNIHGLLGEPEGDLEPLLIVLVLPAWLDTELCIRHS